MIKEEAERLYAAARDASFAAGSIEEAVRLAPNLALARRQVLVELADSFHELGDRVRKESDLLLGRLATVPCPSGEVTGTVGVGSGVAAHPETVGAPAEARSVDDVVRDQIRQLAAIRRALKATVRGGAR